MGKRVKGILFRDYVRMIKSRKDADWSAHLPAGDLKYLDMHINENDWYPFAVFERMGLAIFEVIAGSSMEAVRQFGYDSIDELIRAHGLLVCAENPSESLLRFQVLRRGFFDFEAVYIKSLIENSARVGISCEMSLVAEEAATFQALGFFERLLEHAGAADVQYKFISKSWEGASATVLDLSWSGGWSGR